MTRLQEYKEYIVKHYGIDVTGMNIVDLKILEQSMYDEYYDLVASRVAGIIQLLKDSSQGVVP